MSECVEICNTEDSVSEHPSFHDRLWQRISIDLCDIVLLPIFPSRGKS